MFLCAVKMQNALSFANEVIDISVISEWIWLIVSSLNKLNGQCIEIEVIRTRLKFHRKGCNALIHNFNSTQLLKICAFSVIAL